MKIIGAVSGAAASGERHRRTGQCHHLGISAASVAWGLSRFGGRISGSHREVRAAVAGRSYPFPSNCRKDRSRHQTCRRLAGLGRNRRVRSCSFADTCADGKAPFRKLSDFTPKMGRFTPNRSLAARATPATGDPVNRPSLNIG
jgi:hypothetical protein